MLVKHISERPTPVEQRRADVPPDLARVVMLLLEKDPANRFPSAGAVVVGARHGHACRAFARASTQVRRDRAAERRAPTSRAARRIRRAHRRICTSRSSADAPRSGAAGKRRQVVKFRKKLAPYLFVNGVIVVASVVGADDFFGITGALEHLPGVQVREALDRRLRLARRVPPAARPRPDRRRRRRADVRARDVQSRTSGRRCASSAALGSASRDARPATALPRLPGALAGDDVVARRGQLRRSDPPRRGATANEMLRLLERMPSAERSRIPDVGRSADALAEKVQVSRARARPTSSGASPASGVRRARGGDLRARERRESARRERQRRARASPGVPQAPAARGRRRRRRDATPSPRSSRPASSRCRTSSSISCA